MVQICSEKQVLDSIYLQWKTRIFLLLEQMRFLNYQSHTFFKDARIFDIFVHAEQDDS